MYTTVTISADLNRAIMVRSFHNRSTPRTKPPSDVKRSESQVNTKSYLDSLQRAFNRAKEQVYFNPDMTNFITLTYKKADNTVEEVMHDVKQFLKYERRQSSNPAGSGRERKLKYLYILEYQKRGSIHVHLIANNSFTTYRNKNGYLSLKYWTKGYSSVLHISDFDKNFRPHLYLFKYMRKSQRIGKSFIHSSRNLNNYTKLQDAAINLENWDTVNQEYTHTKIQTTNFHYFRTYMQFNGTMALLTNTKDLNQWHEQVKLHSTKELEKLVKNHTRL